MTFIVKVKVWLLFLINGVRAIFYSVLSTCRNITGRPQISQPILFMGVGRIVIDDTAIIGVMNSPGFLSGYGYFDVRNNNSTIEIGKSVVINNDISIISNGSLIKIGDKTLIGYKCSIIDSDFHGLEPEKRDYSFAKNLSVIIGENVFIGNHVQILKGVKVGNNSVVGSGSVVTKDVPENTVVAGIPARVIKSL